MIGRYTNLRTFYLYLINGLLTCSQLREKIERADDIKAVAAMSDMSTTDERSSTASTSTTDTLVEKAEDDTAVDVVTDTVTPPQTAAAVTFSAASPSAVAVERRKCKEPVTTDTDQSLADTEKATSREAMISPNTKVEFSSSLHRFVH